ncbi:MAG: hypothetical protein JJT95_05185 [Pararhodobacter sp.]|nr:hypothetical protein [Pararhodobacter sp.]
MIRPLALSIAFALFTAPVAADDRPARLEIATRYTQQVMEWVDFEAMVLRLYRPTIDEMRGMGLPISDEQLERLEAVYLAHVTEPLREIMLTQDEVMADIFTLDELQALHEFLQTPTGHSALTRLTELNDAQNRRILSMQMQVGQQVLPQVMEILMPN